MNVAVFADVHGRLRLCFMLCERWERETGEKIDLILQAGDLGAYPDLSRLDKATIRYAENDPTELGFAKEFAVHRPEVAQILNATTFPMIFVRGNHEDHEWLNELEAKSNDTIFPIDVYQRVFCLKAGVPHVFSSGEESVTIFGIGRVGPLIGEPDEYKLKYIQLHEKERIYEADFSSIDILLTHDTALDTVTVGYGMEEIRLVLDAVQPAYHFYGHTGEHCITRLDTNGKTKSIKLSDLHWDNSTAPATIEQGAMGMLRWIDSDHHHFEVVEAPWLSEYKINSWESVE